MEKEKEKEKENSDKSEEIKSTEPLEEDIASKQPPSTRKSPGRSKTPEKETTSTTPSKKRILDEEAEETSKKHESPTKKSKDKKRTSQRGLELPFYVLMMLLELPKNTIVQSILQPIIKEEMEKIKTQYTGKEEYISKYRKKRIRYFFVDFFSYKFTGKIPRGVQVYSRFHYRRCITG